MWPDFLLTPYQLIADEEINPVDERVYAIIYWFRNMKLERCVASNEVIAKYAKTTPRTVQKSIAKLEEKGYILRVYKDVSKIEREELLPLISFGAVRLVGRGGDVPQDVGVRPTGRHIYNNKREEKNDIDTPPAKPSSEVYGDKNFVIFWDLFPKKEGKGLAWSSWKKLKVTQEMADRIIASVKEHLEHHDNWKIDPVTKKPRDGGRFIPHPATYLNQRRFDDEIIGKASLSTPDRYSNVKVTKA